MLYKAFVNYSVANAVHKSQHRARIEPSESARRCASSRGIHDFGEFVTKIATLPRIVTLHDFTITHDTGGLRLQMQAKTYRTASKTEANTL